ncbi:unnamed protein product [Trypanosoma congolense IL3000]|uniref:WGS project CAEQ00000000 data, annotated contig 195 n=1 Tax=Trypanosoma congolense (strain IL3000) TaxID=1068625 RepID=F9WAA9_TRYCI|nr:unnamed protein product [Trypanosoma congolense IL3000]
MLKTFASEVVFPVPLGLVFRLLWRHTWRQPFRPSRGLGEPPPVMGVPPTCRCQNMSSHLLPHHGKWYDGSLPGSVRIRCSGQRCGERGKGHGDGFPDVGALLRVMSTSAEFPPAMAVVQGSRRASIRGKALVVKRVWATACSRPISSLLWVVLRKAFLTSRPA